MREKFVYICSPCRGDTEKNILKAQEYCREAADLWPNVIPIAPHVYFTQFYNEDIPAERAAGMDMGIALLSICDEIWVYGLDNPSEGMRREIEYAKKTAIPIRDASDLYCERQQEERGTRGELLIRFSAGKTEGSQEDPATLRLPCNFLSAVAKWLRRHPGNDYILDSWDENPESDEPDEVEA